MRQMCWGGTIALLVAGALAAFDHRPCECQTPPAALAWSVHFSPKGGCEQAAVAEIKRAKKTVHVQSYSFTNQAIAQALVEAHKNGVDVEVLGDPTVESGRGELGQELAHGLGRGHVLIDAEHAIAHNKVMVIDGKTVLTGSFNWTEPAEHRNAENLLTVHDPDLARAYLANWEKHRAHARAPHWGPR